MSQLGGPGSADAAEELADRAAAWLCRGRGLEPEDLSLYHGRAGAVIALAEAYAHLGDERYAAAAEQGADVLRAGLDTVEDCSLYFGLAGAALALHAVGRPRDAARALERVRARCDGGRWGPMFELLSGNAGIALGALLVGDLELAVAAVTPYLGTADETRHGVNWPVRPSPARSHHLAHGTLGIVAALARVGDAAGRPDLVDLALAGAADVVGRNEAGPDGFLVPHSDPPHRPELIERYSYGWCNGPAGDAQVFRLLGRVTGEPVWDDLQDACWRTVRDSGLPRRLRPGFWDNNGRCCGTAGVLALACDRIVERNDNSGLAEVLVADLAGRATYDDDGACWSNHEHRGVPADLAPHGGWAMGNAGIVPELLRYARIVRGGEPDPAGRGTGGVGGQGVRAPLR